jgi:GT2 family glycosyltransferase
VPGFSKGLEKSKVKNDMSLPSVCIVILNWNCKDDVLECLRSVMKFDYPNYQVMVVDNASTDGSPEAIKSEFLDVKVIVNDANLGFAAGNNVGLQYVLEHGNEYALLLNNDTVVAPNMLRELVTIGENDEQIGIVSPKIYYHEEENKLWYAGARKGWLRGIGATIGLDEEDEGQYDVVQRVDYAFGCGMLIKREVLERVGLLDSRFFLYHEDCDFCLRAAKSGFKTVYVPQARMWHKVSASTKTTSYIQDYHRARSRIIFFTKHLRGFRLLIVLLWEIPHSLRIILSRIQQGKLKNAWACVKGYINGFVSCLSNLGERYR